MGFRFELIFKVHRNKEIWFAVTAILHLFLSPCALPKAQDCRFQVDVFTTKILSRNNDVFDII